MKYCLLACFLFTVSAAMPQQKAAKNVLFIIVDDLKPLLGCYGDRHAQTPNIDRLAATGRVFDHAYCQEAVCAPSRASFMTGKRPDQLQIWGLTQPLRSLHPDIITLPQYFKSNGYTTAAAGKIYHDPPALMIRLRGRGPHYQAPPQTTRAPNTPYPKMQVRQKQLPQNVHELKIQDTLMEK